MQFERLDVEHQKTIKHEQDLSDHCAELQTEVASWKSKSDQLTHAFNVENSDRSLMVLKEKQAWEQEKKDLSEKLEEALRQVEDDKRYQQELLAKQMDAERQHDLQLRAVREEEWAKQRTMESEKRQAEDKMSKALQQAQQDKTEFVHERELLEQELAGYKTELQTLQLRCQSLAAHGEKISAERDEYRVELNEMQQKWARLEALHTKTQMELMETKKREDVLR